MCRVILPLCVAALAAFPVSAATLRVPSEYDTINDALDATAFGDTVLVAPGTYTDWDVRLWDVGSIGLIQVASCAFMRDGVTLLSEAGPESTTIDLQGAQPTSCSWPVVVTMLPSDETLVKGFTITGAPVGRTGLFTQGCGQVHISGCVLQDLDSGTEVGGGIHSVESGLEVIGCEFRNCSSVRGGGVYHYPRDLVIDYCWFDDCANQAVCARSVGAGWYAARIQNSAFTGNSCTGVGAAIFASEWSNLYIEHNIFEGNSAGDAGGGAVFLDGDYVGHDTSVRWNLFVNNHVMSGGSGGGIFWGETGGILAENTFYGCSQATTRGGAAVYVRPWHGVTVERNLFVASVGGAAMRVWGDEAPESFFNIFWENAGGNFLNYVPDATDQFLDPQLCDPENGDFYVAASSACLPQNTSGLCGQIGLYGEGCEAQGTVVVAIATTPEDIEALVDGAPWRTPVLFSWVPGETHTVEVPGMSEGMPGTRYEFSHWEDGGDTVRTIVVPAQPSLFKAVYDTLHYLDMEAEAGGSVTPEDGYYLRFSWVPICAIPDSGFWFTGWMGQGGGSYTGEDSCAAVQMGCPITQIASFRKNVDVTIASDPPGRAVLVDGESFVAPVSFAWELYSEHVISADSIQAEGVGTRYRFEDWSDGGGRTHTITVPWDPLTVTADFVTEHLLSFETQNRGTTNPDDGWFETGTEVQVEATPYAYYTFTHWEGAGQGSYSGPDNPMTLVMNGPVYEEAHFFRIAHEVSLSLSDTDPRVVIGDPIGFGQVYLWLVCSTAGGLKRFEADVTGTMEVLVFTPSPGILNGGDATHLELVSVNCLEGPVLLGSFFVQDPSGGELCLTATASSGRLAIHDCTADTPLVYEYPRDVKIHCLRTDGGVPWVAGRGCDEDEDPPVGIVLCGFAADAKDGCVSLTWCTSFEQSHAGFHVYRSFDPEVSYRRLTQELVSGESPYCWVDAAVEPGMEYFYRLGAVEYSGWETFYGPVSVTTPVRRQWVDGLELARPNPFSSETELRFTLAQPTHVTLSIYDVAGRLVRRLVDEERGAGQHAVIWAGRDIHNRPLPAGVYFSQLVAGDYVEARKLVLVRGE